MQYGRDNTNDNRDMSDGKSTSDAEDLRNHSQILASQVRGTEVYNTQGEHLGSVADIVLSKQSGAAQLAIMSFGGFLGIGERYHPLPWQTLTYDETRGGYVVGLTREQLEGAPSYAVGNEPDWNDRSYGASLGGYYGL